MPRTVSRVKSVKDANKRAIDDEFFGKPVELLEPVDMGQHDREREKEQALKELLADPSYIPWGPLNAQTARFNLLRKVEWGKTQWRTP